MITIILSVAGGVCLLYYIAILIYAGITADFAWIWLFGALVLAAGGGLSIFGKHHPGFFPGWVKWLVIAAAAAGLAVFLFVCSGVVRGMYSQGSEGLEYVVVLGAQVKGEQPSRALSKRLQKALEYAKENPDTILILSGGQGSGEDITEAECMRRWLEEAGVAPERLILEEASTSTRENLKFSDELTGCKTARTGILSNNFHVYRAVALARKLGYTQAEGIAAVSDPLMQPHYVVREVFALVKEKLMGNI